jgi:hypothetical protein
VTTKRFTIYFIAALIAMFSAAFTGKKDTYNEAVAYNCSPADTSGESCEVMGSVRIKED